MKEERISEKIDRNALYKGKRRNVESRNCEFTSTFIIYVYIYILAQVIRYQSEILADFRTMGKRIALINREAT